MPDLPARQGRRAVAVIIEGIGVSEETELHVRALFPPSEVPEALEVVGWYDDEQAEEVHRAVVALSKGDMERLLGLVMAAVDDFRDVLMWASLPEPTREERAAAQARNRELVRRAAQARRRYLESRYGVEGADRIERSNQRLFGKPHAK